MLAADTAAPGEQPVERRTVAGYLAALARLFVTEEIPPWRPHIASRAQARRSPKLMLCDPSLTAAALGIGTEHLLADLAFAGRFFESLALRDLLVYAQANRCTLSHYRDSHHLEADAIVEHPDGRWAALEIKLGGAQAIDHAATSLPRLRDRIDQSRTGPLARLAVITATGHAYERPDGIAVAPITALAP